MAKIIFAVIPGCTSKLHTTGLVMISCLLQAICQLLHSLQLYLQEAQADPAHVGSGPQWKTPPVSDPVLQTPAAVDDLLNRCLSQAEQQVHSSYSAAWHEVSAF